MKKNEETTPTVEDTIKELKKQYGEDVILESGDFPQDIEIISTNCFALDRLLGCFGLPKGRILEIYGQPGEGKSTLCLFLAAQVQKAGGLVVWADAENAYEASYAENVGVDIKKLLVSQPATLEETFDMIKAFVATEKIALIVVDSVAALVPRSELESKEMLKDTMAVQARLLSKALRIITGPISRSNTIVIFINQVRDKVATAWGNPEVSVGGKALKFFSSIRLRVSKGDKILGKDDEQIGNKVKITAVKNKVGMPFRKGSFDLYYGSGVDQVADTFDTAIELGIISKEGITYSYAEQKLAIGRDKSIEVLKSLPDVYKKLRSATTEAVKKEK
jgi:recombination protein RecA